MEAVLLCGGLGTRLRSVVSDRPKPLADIGGKAFMEYVTDQLVQQGIKDIVFAVGYKGQMVEDYFGDGSRFGFRAAYSYEEEPLGTGGAIRHALPKLRGDRAYVLNADTYYKIDFTRLERCMDHTHASMALFTREVPDISRYGEVKSEQQLLCSWNEKSDAARPGEINGGIYLIRRELLETMPEGKASLEHDWIPQWLSQGVRIATELSDAYFIDIGVPESYRRFREDVAAGRVGEGIS
jgi:NDP-sugar pyrophosphorylase family protein